MTKFIRNGVGPFLMIATGLLLILLVRTETNSLLRALVAFSYLLICPGMAWVYLLQIENTLSRWTVAVALSLAIETLIGILLLYAQVYSPENALFAIVGMTVVGLLVSWWRARSQPTDNYTLFAKSGNNSASNLSVMQPSMIQYNAEQYPRQSGSTPFNHREL